MDQPNHHAYVRLPVDGTLMTSFSFWTELEEARRDGEEVRRRIVERTRQLGHLREQIEQEIAEDLRPAS